MVIYRITSRAYARDLSGTGAMLFGGRWNPKGVRMLYTSESLSLAVLEVIANLSGGQLSNLLYAVRLELPDDLPVFEPSNLPLDWQMFPHGAETVSAGQAFIKANKYVCMRVPSAIIPSEYNYLLNPMHELYDRVKYLDANPIMLDKRLIKP